MTVSSRPSEILKRRLSRVTPALLTSTVGSPRSATTFSTAAPHLVTVGDVGPERDRLATRLLDLTNVRAPSSSLRSSTATAIPSAARRLAVPAPMPRAAPVTIAIRCGIKFVFPSSARTCGRRTPVFPATLFRTARLAEPLPRTRAGRCQVSGYKVWGLVARCHQLLSAALAGTAGALAVGAGALLAVAACSASPSSSSAAVAAPSATAASPAGAATAPATAGASSAGTAPAGRLLVRCRPRR